MKSVFERDHGIRMEDHDWETTLIMFALPFARGLLTVVAPDGYRIHEAVYETARKRKVDLSVTPLKRFSVQEIERLASCQLVSAVEMEPEPKYSKAVEKAIGEKQTVNRSLVPKEWLSFGMER